MEKKAIIFGITGQDGSYLAELLLSKGYEVHGVTRRTSRPNTQRLKDIIHFITIHQSDLTDQGSISRLIHAVAPDEVYNLAAQSFVKASFDHPVSTGDMTALGVTRILESIRDSGISCKFYQASSSEMFGKAQDYLQNESTPFHPRSPYGVAKLYGHWMTVNYRESYGMYAVSGILFNHESPRRGVEFVTRKITDGVARIKLGLQDRLYLGNLDARRDWGHARDYVRAMWLMLQQEEPSDYVVASGEARSVKDFVQRAFAYVGLDFRDYVSIDPKFCRPAEVHHLLGDSTKARNVLGWEPEINFDQLVSDMVEADVDRLRERQPHS